MKTIFIKSQFMRIGYEVREEYWQSSPGEKPIKMKSCYNPSGIYIGNIKDTQYLFGKIGLRIVEPRDPGIKICNVGFNPDNKKWYGWSHRAIVGFKIGNMIFEEKYGDDNTPFIKHGRIKITTLAEARQAAANFAEYIS